MTTKTLRELRKARVSIYNFVVFQLCLAFSNREKRDYNDLLSIVVSNKSVYKV